MMFNDHWWLNFREERQQGAMSKWLASVKRPVVIELGAGTHIPSARIMGQSIDAPMIRINVRESQVPRNKDIGLPMGALAALHGIAQAPDSMSEH